MLHKYEQSLTFYDKTKEENILNSDKCFIEAVQKYKNIIDTMVQQQKETNFKKAYEQETGDPLYTEDNGLEELELYLRELREPTVLL